MEPENDGQLFEILQWMSNSPEEVREMGRRGRRYVVRNFNRDDLADDMFDIVRRTADGEVFCAPDREWKIDPDKPSPESAANSLAAESSRTP